jgi:putative ABC transport system permease protein
VLRASLSWLLSYRGRLTATVLALVLGVGFVTGTLIFTDALRTTFYDRFAQAERGVDAAVTARDDGRLDETALDAARTVPGVAVAEPRLADRVRILDRDGRPHAPDRRERTLGISVASDPRLRWQDATSGGCPRPPARSPSTRPPPSSSACARATACGSPPRGGSRRSRTSAPSTRVSAPPS